eukprot:6207378-Pleurochrysis_carterae.AAC.1
MKSLSDLGFWRALAVAGGCPSWHRRRRGRAGLVSQSVGRSRVANTRFGRRPAFHATRPTRAQ